MSLSTAVAIRVVELEIGYMVEMEDVNEVDVITYQQLFRTKQEAQGFITGWNAHRGCVSEYLFLKSYSRT